MTQSPYKEPQFLGLVGTRNRGDYRPEDSYRKLDFVYYKGSTWLAKIDDPDKEPGYDSLDQWQLMALGYPEANNLVRGVKGDAEIDYRDGLVNITKKDIGLGEVTNISLEGIQQNTVASFSYNGEEQKLKGDIDIPLVNGIVFNDEVGAKTGIVHIHTVTGIVINDSEVQNGVIILDTVNSVKVNNHEFQKGYVELSVVEGINLNGEKLKLKKDGTIDIIIEDPVIPVQEVYLNGTFIKPDEGKVYIEIDDHPIKEIYLNEGLLEPVEQKVNFEAVTSLSVNGKNRQIGDVDLNLIEDVYFNGKLIPPQNGTLSIETEPPKVTSCFVICDTDGDISAKEIDVPENFGFAAGDTITVSFKDANSASDLVFVIDESQYPVLVRGESVNEATRSTFQRNGVYTFIFDGLNWNYLSGTNDIYEVYPTTFQKENWINENDYWYQDVEINSIDENSFIEILEPFGLDLDSHAEIALCSFWALTQEKGKARIGSASLPDIDLSVMIKVN